MGDLGRAGNIMRDQIIEALKTRGRSDAEADMIVRRLVNAAKDATSGTHTEAQATRIITREIEKVVLQEMVVEKLTEAVLIPPVSKTVLYKSGAKPEGANVIEILRNGRPEWYRIQDKDLFEFFKTSDSMFKGEMQGVWRLLQKPAVWLRAGAVTHPAFSLLTNPLRDMAQAMVYSKGAFIPIVSSVRGFLMEAGVYKKDIYIKWLQSGGERAALIAMDKYGDRKAMETFMHKALPERAADMMAHPVRSFLEILQSVSEFTEMGTRLAVFDTNYRYYKRQGMLEQDAILMAMEASKGVTLDYSRHGLWGKKINSLSAFWNANIQGADKFFREFRIDKNGVNNPGAWLKAMAGITLPSVITAILHHDDPGYRDAPWYWKDLFWLIPHPGRKQKLLEEYARKGRTWEQWSYDEKAEFEKQYPIYKFPKPFELGLIFGSIPERFTAWMMDRQQGVARGGETARHQAAHYMTKGLGQDVLNAFLPSPLPTAIKPLLEAYWNKSSFTGRSIVPETKKDAPNVDQYGAYTTETAKVAAKILDPILRPIGADFLKLNSPAVVEHYMRSYGGRIGFQMLQVTDRLFKALVQDPFVKQYAEEKGWGPYEKMTIPQRLEVADAFRKRNQVSSGIWIDFRMDPMKTLADHLFWGPFVVRYPSANTESVRRFFEVIAANKKTQDFLQRQLIEKEFAPGKYMAEVERMEKAGELYKLGMAKDKGMARSIQKASQILSTIEGLNYAPMTPEEKQKLISIHYFMLIDLAETTLEVWDKARDREAAKADKKSQLTR